MSDRFTVRSFVSPCTLTVALSAFSSIETTVASTAAPLIVTFTLSPAFHPATAEAGAGASTEGLGAGVAVDWVAGLAVGCVASGAGAHAASRTHKANTGR